LVRYRSDVPQATHLVLRDVRHTWPDGKPNDYQVLHAGKVVGRIVKVQFAGTEERWAWSIGGKLGGYVESCEAAMVGGAAHRVGCSCRRGTAESLTLSRSLRGSLQWR
jgi:hypothetical protein